MKASSCWIATLLIGVVTGLVLSQDPAVSVLPGFRSIFSGQDLTGWEGSPEYWSVKDGCLTGVTDGTLKYNRFIIWCGGTLKNFELRMDVKVTAGGNSGI